MNGNGNITTPKEMVVGEGGKRIQKVLFFVDRIRQKWGI